MAEKIKIYLCDFMHNYSGVGAYMFPLNVGFVASYALKLFPKEIEIELFKFPQDFLDAVKKKAPDIAGFSNYIWSADINNKFSQFLKKKYSHIIIVFGGPDINCTEKGYKRFFSTHPAVDFYIVYQGEKPFSSLLKKIIDKGPDIDKLKSENIEGVVSSKNNSIFAGKIPSRIKNPDDIPSPYLTGLLDKFFDTKLMPLVESNRGCPYQCTYCAQGAMSQHNMEFFSLERVKKELDYIAERVKNTNLLTLADSNFGIVERDWEIAKHIIKLKKEKGYPRKFNTNWAKNQPKIYELAKILNNTNLIVSLQSLDTNVLKNIKRQNIDINVFKEIIDKINSTGEISATEIILGLPGETKESHLKTLRTLFDWNISYIICYQPMLLDGSEMSIMKENGQFNCKTKFRYVDNCFGKYDGIMSIEAEEGIRATDDLSEEEMKSIRPIHWLIQYLWNYRFSFLLLKYMHTLKINPLDFIINVINNFEDKNTPQKLNRLFSEFKEDMENEWFNSKEEMQKYFFKSENFKALEEGKYGKLQGKYIIRFLLEAKKEFEDYLCEKAVNFSKLTQAKADIIREISRFLSASSIDFNETWDEISGEKIIQSHYNILEWVKSGFKENLDKFYDKNGIKIRFYIPDDQKKALNMLLKQYDHPNKNVTLRKMTEWMDIRDMFRKAEVVKNV